MEAAIIEIFRNGKNAEMTHGELKSTIEISYRKGRKLPSALFSSRLKQMISNCKDPKYLVNPILKKRDYGRGRNVLYSLAEKAWIRLEVELPILKEDSTREKAYQLLLH